MINTLNILLIDQDCSFKPIKKHFKKNILQKVRIPDKNPNDLDSLGGIPKIGEIKEEKSDIDTSPMSIDLHDVLLQKRP